VNSSDNRFIEKYSGGRFLEWFFPTLEVSWRFINLLLSIADIEVTSAKVEEAIRHRPKKAKIAHQSFRELAGYIIIF
jgi:hypothetical protein|tara:strand:+ start:769 stop:999 length:231 start_codon:yes stop_codon:yes gene_type:complete